MSTSMLRMGGGDSQSNVLARRGRGGGDGGAASAPTLATRSDAPSMDMPRILSRKEFDLAAAAGKAGAGCWNGSNTALAAAPMSAAPPSPNPSLVAEEDIVLRNCRLNLRMRSPDDAWRLPLELRLAVSSSSSVARKL